MALTISRNNNTFTVEGKLNACTASNFKTHFNLTLNCLKDLTIDISKVNEIDTNGVAALKVIYDNAKSWNKPFSIVGKGCKDVYEELLNIA
ncbi:MAG: STAS domain-containing protein [Olleya sp.]